MTSPAIAKSLRRGSAVAIFLRHRCCVSWHVFGIQLWSYCRLVSLWASWIGKKTGIRLWMGDGWKVEILDEELQSFTQEATAITQVLHVFLLVFQSFKCSHQVSYPFLSCYIWFCQTSCKHLEYWNSWDLCHVQRYLKKMSLTTLAGMEFLLDFKRESIRNIWSSQAAFPWHAMFWVWFISSSNAMGLRTLRRGTGMRVWEKVPEILS